MAEARFGMFVHWGLYSGLAGDWNGKMAGDSGGLEWIQQRVGADTYILLNIGPTGDGSVPPESIATMTAVGRWMDVNAEAIRGTTGK